MLNSQLTRRGLLKTGGALVVSFALAPAWAIRAAGQSAPWGDTYLGKPLSPDTVDSFLVIHADGSVTLFSGKVDLGTGARAALRQMAAEELDIPIDRITLIEGDTALTPDQGPTAGSTGVSRGGVQIRQAAATARQALLDLASKRLGQPVSALEVVDGAIRPKSGGGEVRYGELVGGQHLNLGVDQKAPRKDPASYRIVGKPVPRPDVPAKVTGRHIYVHDFTLPGMLHGRVIRPPAIGAKLVSVDDSSIASLPGARVVRIANFLGVCVESEWEAIRAGRQPRAIWSPAATLPDQARLFEAVRATPVVRDETIGEHGDAAAALARASRTISATYQWPIQTHGSMGPSCAVAEVTPDQATVWTASQATYKYRPAFPACWASRPTESA
jgi:nicotinate dehydrogenase subunit B